MPEIHVTRDDVHREDFDLALPERESLMAFIRWQRDTLRLKCADLTAEQLAQRPVPPSAMSLLGIVRHMADVEHGWFVQSVAGLDEPPPYRTEDEPDADWAGAVADDDVVRDAFARWTAACERSDQIAAGLDLDATTQMDEWTMSLRSRLLHSIEEYARHNGHADLIREQVDGRTGE
ncbi:DinB family protein [Angustibacter aerolatus]